MKALVALCLVVACSSAPKATTAPADLDAEDARGEALLLRGAFDEASRVFESVRAKRPNDAAAYHGIAMVRLHRGDIDGGIAALNAGLAVLPEIDPSYGRTRLLEALAWTHALAGREREAVETMEASVTAQGLEAPIAERVKHLGRARLLMHAKRWSDAAAEVAAARGTDAPPFVVRASFAVEAIARARGGELDRADAAIAELAAFPEPHPVVLEAKAAVAIAKRDFAAASALADELAAQDPYAAEETRLALAFALRDAGKTVDAARQFRQLAAQYLRSTPSVIVRRTAERAISGA